MVEYLLWLLLPVAAASGWWAARRSYKKHQAAGSTDRPQPGYFKGLNYILNEQPDKAIEVFVEMVQVDSETVETHLALGNLFRKRGEVDRAIRIHQNLIARPTLNVDQRAHALAELGQDYMSAGLLDRAENIFSELVDNPQYRALALRFLKDIYQSEQEWDKAIKVLRSMTELSRKDRNQIIAQYYCELAEQAHENNDLSLVKRHLKQAIGVDPQCARASLLQGKLEWDSGNVKNALRCYDRFVSQSPQLSDEVIERVYACHQQLGTVNKFLANLGRLPETKLGPLTRRLELRLHTSTSDEEDYRDAVWTSLQERPTLSLTESWLELLLDGKTVELHEELQKLLAVIQRLTEQNKGYRCQHCGYVAKSLHWLCPSCKHWDSTRPINVLDS